MLPKTYILTDRVNLTILDEQYQYMVTYSIFGEILKIECPFLKLPVNAQKLTKGKDTEKYLHQLEYQKKLLQYKMPLAILGFWKTKEFDQINEAIASRENELGTEVSDDFLGLITDPWLIEFYGKVKKDIDQKGTGDFWRGLAGLMRDDPVVLEESFRYLRAYSWKLPAEIIANLWPTISDRRTLRHFYEHAHLYPHQLTKSWLLKVLPTETSTFFRTLMLRGLSLYSDEIVYNYLINHYETQKEMGEGESEILISALSNFKTEKVRNISWDALIGKNYFAAKAAHQALKKQAVSEKLIAEKLKSTILNDKYSDRVNSLLSRFQNLENTNLLISGEQFILRSAVAVKKDKNIRPQTNLASLLDRTWQPTTFGIIIDLLYHPEPMVRRLGLDQISSLVVQFPDRMKDLNLDTVKRIFILTGDSTESVRVESVETIRRLVPRLGRPSWIISLLNIQNRRKLLSNILPAVEALHRKSFTELSVVPFCIQNLYSKSINIKRYSILILQYYNIPEVNIALGKLRSDPDAIIQEALSRGWRDDDELIKIL